MQDTERSAMQWQELWVRKSHQSMAAQQEQRQDTQTHVPCLPSWTQSGVAGASRGTYRSQLRKRGSAVHLQMELWSDSTPSTRRRPNRRSGRVPNLRGVRNGRAASETANGGFWGCGTPGVPSACSVGMLQPRACSWVPFSRGNIRVHIQNPLNRLCAVPRASTPPPPPPPIRCGCEA